MPSVGVCEESAGRQVDADAAIDLRDALDILSSRDREVITLRYLFDLTQPQVAAVLGTPEGTTKIRLHRARARLRAILEGHGN